MSYDELIAKLVAIRKELKLTQREVADRMGSYQGHVTKLERRLVNRSNWIILSSWANALNHRIRIHYTLEPIIDEED